MRIGTHVEPVSDAERAESARRDRALWWYLFRGPAWENVSRCACRSLFCEQLVERYPHRPRLDGLAKRWQNRTLLGFASTLLQDCELPRSALGSSFTDDGGHRRASAGYVLLLYVELRCSPM